MNAPRFRSVGCKQKSDFVAKLLKYLAVLNLMLAVAGGVSGAWVARTVGSQAYVAGGLAALIVAIATSLALVITFVTSKANSGDSSQANGPAGVSGILLAMLVRLGLPIASAVLMMQTKSPLLAAGFLGQLTFLYLLALPVETVMSLQFTRPPNRPNPPSASSEAND